MNAVTRLRELLARPDTHFIPACYDALSTRMIAHAGYPLAFLSGYGVSASRLGLPDIGYSTQTEVAAQVRDICGPLPGFPLIADADTGYGNAMNARRTVTEFARAGAAGLLLEDQITPKRCGHIGPRAVVSRQEARMKIRAAVDARRESGLDIVILARTDARRLLGFEEALARCLDFQAEGADIVFMEALQDVGEMRRFVRAMEVATWGNNSRGQENHMAYLSRAEVRDIGFRIVTDPTLLFSVAHAIEQHLAAHRADDEAAYPPQVTFGQMNTILDLGRHTSVEARYAAAEGPGAA
ncbi:isocitrate lyase/PEP mutase family protein [Variovorax terrae]|uniref:Isocitrate lyase/PEP mutase family protein n=1 Tax=Variovorax terrae TaxID=2923278 RepID=A0A9X2ARC3_9BURK|nr:isocitrate lyase/PEP mutase family protein [Variovorax terrae]MCJ0765502.1 isocitrate lyase/PEP mutase family protein [Variovorax terrae]